jgi:hypothetical protein
MAIFARIISCLLFSLSFGSLLVQGDAVGDKGIDLTVQRPLPLQFASNNHVIGFDIGAVYMTGLDHKVQIGFDRALPVQPIAYGSQQTTGRLVPLEKVSYINLWDNIDAEYRAAPGGIAESTYVIHPGGNPREIVLNYNAPVEITAGGALQLGYGNGVLEESRPLAWQEINGNHEEVAVAYRKAGERQVGFQIGRFDDGRTLYIDPTYVWHAFYGSAGYDTAYSVATDASSNVYIVGYSAATWNGPAGQAPRKTFVDDPVYHQPCDLFVLKLSSSGDYQWHTFYGLATPEDKAAVALDSDGNVFVGGFSNLYWDGPAGQPPKNAPNPPGASDFFVLKLDSAGNYLWHTFYGCSHYDPFYALAVDSHSNVIAAANSRLPWTGPSGQGPKHAHSFIPSLGIPGDFAILKLNSEGDYLWHTFYGSLYGDDPGGLAVDAADNIYMVGTSDASWTAPAAPLQPYIGGVSTYNMAVLKLSSAGDYQWHTFYGSGQQSGSAVALDADANIYAVGNCGISWNGPGGKGPLHAITNLFDMTILKLNSSGSYLWHTYYGGNANDSAAAVATGPCGVFVAGYGLAGWTGPAGQQPVSNYTAGRDWTVLHVGSGGDYGWHSFYGSSGSDTAQGLSLNSNNLYVVGDSEGTWPGAGLGQPKNAYKGLADAAVIRLSGAVVPTISSFSPAEGVPGTEVTITGCAFSGTTAVNFGNIPAASFTVVSDTFMRATTGTGATGRITVITAGGQGASATDFVFPSLPNNFIGTNPGGSGGYITAPVIPLAIPLPNVQVQSASLSSSAAAPSSSVTVTARVINRGNAEGNARVTLYVNGQQESSQSVKVGAAGNVPVIFTVARDEPGTYSVYVGGVPAGSFTVNETVDPNNVLYISLALIFVAVAAGAIYFVRKRQLRINI